MVIKKIIFIIFLAQFIWAQTDPVAIPDESKITGESPILTPKQLRILKPVNMGVSWAPLSLWMPSKFGAAVSYNLSERKTLSAEYQYQTMKFPVFSIDIGQIREQKYGVTLKSFGDSERFYVSYSLLRYSFRAGLNEKLFPGGNAPLGTLFDISSVGFQWSIGNQWSWDNGVNLGIDWFSIYFHAFEKNKNVEVFKSLSESNRDKANKVVSTIYNIPIFEILKIQFTYGF